MADAFFLFGPQVNDVPVNSDGLHAGWKPTLLAHIKCHTVQAMRFKAGNSLQPSNGNGLRTQVVIANPEAGLAEVVEMGRGPEPFTRLTLIQVLAKAGHDEQTIDMATQIGIDQIVPWQADRSITEWKVDHADKKWNSVLDVAIEQSWRTFKLQLEVCVSNREVMVIHHRAYVYGGMVTALHQGTTDTWSGVEEKVAQLVERTLQDGRLRTISMMVGPEGDTSEQEVADFAKAGAVSCVLGRNILRAAATGPVALSLLSRVLGRYG